MWHDGLNGWGMGWGMGLFGLLFLVALILSIAALLKYLFTNRDETVPHMNTVEPN